MPLYVNYVAAIRHTVYGGLTIIPQQEGITMNALAAVFIAITLGLASLSANAFVLSVEVPGGNSATTTTEPSLARSGTDSSGSGSASVDLRTGTIRLAAQESSVLGSLSDTLFFSIPDNGPTDTTDIRVRVTLDGVLFSRDNGVLGSRALFQTVVGTGLTSGTIDVSANWASIVDASDPQNPINAPVTMLSDPDAVRSINPDDPANWDILGPNVFEGVLPLTGPNPEIEVFLSVQAIGDADLTNTATFEFVDLPSNVTFTSESGFFLVPIPAAVWLFGSALGLLGWIRRKAT